MKSQKKANPAKQRSILKVRLLNITDLLLNIEETLMIIHES